MAKQVIFHSDFHTCTVVINGVPYAVNGEVDITLKQPAKLPSMDQRTWQLINAKSVESISVGGVQGGREVE